MELEQAPSSVAVGSALVAYAKVAQGSGSSVTIRIPLPAGTSTVTCTLP